MNFPSTPKKNRLSKNKILKQFSTNEIQHSQKKKNKKTNEIQNDKIINPFKIVTISRLNTVTHDSLDKMVCQLC